MSDSDGGVPLIEDQFDNIHPSRKRRAQEALEPFEPDLDEAERKKAKKAKLKAKNKIRNRKGKEVHQQELDQELGVNHVFERMDEQLLADYINARTRLYGRELSSDEQEKLCISALSVKDSTSWTEPRVTDKLSAFLKKQASDLKATPSKLPGAPHTIVITASGIRAADVVRSLKAGLPKEGVKNPEVAKLFAKHLKLPAQVYDLKRKKIDFGVGTPDRLMALLEDGALSTANLKQVVIDVSYIDQKKLGILDMKQLHEPLIKLLLRKEFVGADKQGGEGLFLFY